MAEKYILQVTAGPEYSPSTHRVIPVNSATPTSISSSRCTLSLSVRVQNYGGLPRTSPRTSPYFSSDPHTRDAYSISFHLTPGTDIPGGALVFGNDFDKPVRDRLPPGFGTAFRIVKWGIDPGLEGDMYADEPYLYGCALSSFNTLWVGSKKQGDAEEREEMHSTQEERERGDAAATGDMISEGGSAPSGQAWRHERGVPDPPDARKKWGLTPSNQEKWVWEAGRTYGFDFFNPYLDFNTFSLKLPGFSLSLMGYLGRDDFLRYALKNKDTGEVLFVVVFNLLERELIERQEKEEKVQKEKETDTMGQADEAHRAKGEGADIKIPDDGKGFEPQEDDVD